MPRPKIGQMPLQCSNCGGPLIELDNPAWDYGRPKIVYLCMKDSCIQQSFCELLQAQAYDQSHTWPKWLVEKLKELLPRLPMKNISGQYISVIHANLFIDEEKLFRCDPVSAGCGERGVGAMESLSGFVRD